MIIFSVVWVPQTPTMYLASSLCWWHIYSLYCTDRKEGYVLRKLQRGLTSMESWCELCDVTIENKNRAIDFSRRCRTVDDHLTLNGLKIMEAACRNTKANVFITFLVLSFIKVLRVYSLFKSEELSTDIKITPHKALNRSTMIYVCSAKTFAAETYLLKLHRTQNKVVLTTGNFPKRTPACSYHVVFIIPYVYDIIQAANRNHTKSRKWKCSLHRTRRSQTQET
jgi:hypothetical protein